MSNNENIIHKYKKYKYKYEEYIKNLLESSVYPGQLNDFFFLKVPEWINHSQVTQPGMCLPKNMPNADLLIPN